jgi:uncharacterized protein YqeY
VIEQRLRTALRAAMRDRDTVAVRVLRSTLAALDNATAVPGPAAAPAGDEHVAGSAVGLGAAEAARRELTEDEAVAIVRAEIAERVTAADQYGGGADQYGGAAAADQYGGAAADRLRAEAACLAAYLDGPSP